MTINNYIATPTYHVQFDKIECTRNIVMDVVEIRGKSFLTCYIYMEPGKYSLVYSDNTENKFCDPDLILEFGKKENVIKSLSRFKIFKSEEIPLERMHVELHAVK